MAITTSGIMGKLTGCIGPYKFRKRKDGSIQIMPRRLTYPPSQAQLLQRAKFSILIKIASKVYLPYLKSHFVKPDVYYTAICRFMHWSIARYTDIWCSPPLRFLDPTIHEAPSILVDYHPRLGWRLGFQHVYPPGVWQPTDEIFLMILQKWPVRLCYSPPGLHLSDEWWYPPVQSASHGYNFTAYAVVSRLVSPGVFITSDTGARYDYAFFRVP